MSSVAISDPDRLAIATIRTLCIDAVQRANSGHPGTPMAMAPVAYTTWQLGFTPDAVVGIARARLAASAGG
jgi:transketolase